MRNHLHLPYKVLLALAVVVVGLAPTAAGASGGGADTVPSGALGGLRYHVVAPGDTVGSIAQTYGVDADVLRRANGLVGDRLYRGARVLVDPPNAALGRAASDAASSSTSSSGGGATTGSGSSASVGTYVVEEGDVLERIARRQGVKLSNLLAANDLSASSVIMPGQRLTIPTAGSGTTVSSGSGSTYVVEEGDVLERIARHHGVKLSALLSANGLNATTLILPGKVLAIPAGGSGSSSGSGSGSSGSAASDGTGSTSWIGPRIICPVPGASFMNDWGFPRGSERFHEGTDMFAPAGTTIVAPVSGTLAFGSNGLGGTTFTITSPDGWVVYGAHMSDTIGSGGQVAAGTPVGRVGSSGNAAGGDAHLHLSIKPSAGRSTNPYPSVIAACG
ncbi:MAG: LysM peptidoglycan-binding domain-containing protein [Microthrixaceae bacterium]